MLFRSKEPNCKNNISRVFVMPQLMKNDTAFVFVAHLGPEIIHFMFSRWWTAAILDLVVTEEPKRKNNNFQCVCHARVNKK